MKQAVILAGGKGTRLRERLGDLPKPLVDVGGLPLLLRQLKALEQYGYEEAIILVNYKAEAIVDFVGSADLKIKCRIIDDGEPRGTAGAVLAILGDLADQFLVVYGDTLFDVDFGRFGRSMEANVAEAALFLHPNDHPEDSDLVELDADSRVLGFHPYPHPEGSYYQNLVNAALYILKKAPLLKYADLPPPLDFAKDLFPRMVRDGVRLAGYVSSEYIKDIGTPARLDKAAAALARGDIERASYRTKQKAVFIDRDGTLNEERGFISSPDALVLFPGVADSLKRLNESSYRAIVVTNQPVIARGEATYADLRRIHGKLDMEVAKKKAFFDGLYFCPHHPDSGFPGEVAELKRACSCRKPEPGLILQAQRDMNIDLSESWFIGDSTADFAAAKKAGVRSIGVSTGSGGKDGKYPVRPDYSAENFTEAVELILKN